MGSDEVMRRAYDEGNDVRDEAAKAAGHGGSAGPGGPGPGHGNKEGFKADPNSWSDPDPETGRRTGKAHRYDPETGEEETEDIIIEPVFPEANDSNNSSAPAPAPARAPLKRHCCLPNPFV